jgi:tetratricopeptide (TPR) repeat protein
MKGIKVSLIVLGVLSLLRFVLVYQGYYLHHPITHVSILLGPIIGICVAILSFRYATHLGRSGIGWAIGGFLFPVIAIVLAFMKSARYVAPPAVRPVLQATAYTIPSPVSTPVAAEPVAPIKITIPKIDQEYLSVSLVESSTLSGNAGAGGAAFQQAIQNANNRNDDGALRSYREALGAGLDPLRQGYAHANIGTILLLKKRDLAGAVEEFLTVLKLKQALYESVHDAAQYMSLILQEAGRQQEADELRKIAGKTAARLGYSLAPDVAEKVRNLARSASFESAASGASVLASTPVKVAMQTYRSTKRNLSFDYPAGWEVIWENEPEGGWEIIVGVAGPKTPKGRACVSLRMLPDAVINFYGEHVTVSFAGGPGAPSELVRTPDAYNEECKQELRKVLPGVTFLSSETGTLAGMPTGTMLYSYPGTNGRNREKQINLFGKDVTYRLMGEAPEEQSAFVETFFDSLVTSLFPVEDPHSFFKLR